MVLIVGLMDARARSTYWFKTMALFVRDQWLGIGPSHHPLVVLPTDLSGSARITSHQLFGHFYQLIQTGKRHFKRVDKEVFPVPIINGFWLTMAVFLSFML
uniref:Uncharacterized protein n=1 Tax=Cacopsylla melanoneura TaxID=428564 RepID=A0A8D9B718_9HEMI